MASAGPLVPSDLSRLTVPQLKALCKERRIAGYSRLSKAALLQKLTEVAAPTKTTPPQDAASNATVVPSVLHTDGTRSSTHVASLSARDVEALHQPARPSTKSTETSTEKAPLPTQPPQNRVSTSTRETSAKRPAHTDISVPSKRTRTSLKPAGDGASHEPPAPSTVREKLPVDSSGPELPLSVKPQRSSLVGVSTLSKQPSGVARSIAPHEIIYAGRFKPLVPSTPRPVQPGQPDKQPLQAPVISVTPRGNNTALDLSLQTMSLPVLSHIPFPPKASERKWVYRWAVVLSALSPSDRQTCTLVSRTFRYAVYLSAAHILSRHYPGRRLDTLFQQHPRNMTNLWPYLRLRRAEVPRRRRAFGQSFLGRFVQSIGYDPLSARLWTSPDDEKQVDVALRFVLTRMWFAVSVGAYGHDASAWSKSVIQDVREIGQGDIWQVVARDVGGETCSFHVLEATCEVIGQSLSEPADGSLDARKGRLRLDWTAWISERSQAPPRDGTRPCSLLECVKWSNTEDYHRGISKAWLLRVQGQDANQSAAKRRVAERYILASVVANGISGQWMSTSAMAQDFAGLPCTKDTLGSRTAGRSTGTVNLYLAAHHHIESVHFTTSRGEALHGAVAVVQTPGREYYVLRDNGMQIGCEEEGIPRVWQEIIGCDMVGRPRSVAAS